MTGTTINATQYDAILHLLHHSDSKSEVADTHRFALRQGGWGKPSPDLSVLNSLSDQDMQTGLNKGWNIESDERHPLPTNDARQNAAMSTVKNGVYGIMPTPQTPDVPKRLSVTSEQLTTIGKILSFFGDSDTVPKIHGVMLARGGWSGDHALLNNLSETDVQDILSGNRKLDVAKPRPVVLVEHPNGVSLTQEQVTAIEHWFAEPENLKYDRDDLLRIINDGNIPASLQVIWHVPVREIMVALYVGYAPIT